MKSMMGIKFLILSLGLLIGAPSFACSLKGASSLRHFISLEAGKASRPSDDHRLSLSGCNKDKRFLLVGLAPILTDIRYDFLSSYNGLFFDDYCKIRPLPFEKELTYQQRLENYQAKSDFLKLCVKTLAVDLGPRGLQFPEQEANCQIERIDRRQAFLKGGSCYLRARETSDFMLEPQVDPRCQDPSYLRANGINPNETMAQYTFFASGDSSGTGTDLTVLSTVKFNFSIDANENQMQLSQGYSGEMARFPTEDAFDVHIDIPQVQTQPDSYEVKLPFFIDHQCRRTCVGESCSSPCDYVTPFAADIVLERKRENGKFSFLENWYGGAVLPPMWQGRLITNPFSIDKNKLTPGETYRIRAKLYDQTTLYSLSFEFFKSFLVDKLNLDPNRVGRDLIEPIKGITDGPIVPFTPIIRGLRGVGRDGDLRLQDYLGSVLSFLGIDNWPPYMTTICNQERTSCIPSRNFREPFAKLSIEFTLDEVPFQGRLGVSNIKWKREAALLPNYERQLSSDEFPNLVCGQHIE